MKKFIVEEEFWSLFPDARIGVVVCKGVDNSARDSVKYEEMLRKSETEARRFFEKEEFSSNPVIAVWREAFKQFKTKKGARASIEALLKRVQNGNQIGTINPLVDIYNSVSLRYGLPCGGEDTDKFMGDLLLTTANGTEQFIPLGEEENSPPYEGEIVYKDDAGAICRCWNWREALRTILTENTKNAFLCIELVDETRLGELEGAERGRAGLVAAPAGLLRGILESHQPGQLRVLHHVGRRVVLASAMAGLAPDPGHGLVGQVGGVAGGAARLPLLLGGERLHRPGVLRGPPRRVGVGVAALAALGSEEIRARGHRGAQHGERQHPAGRAWEDHRAPGRYGIALPSGKRQRG
jgi:DNA/RNA-binding domain of Phe-tRNA-synthetase-like protein